MSFQKNDLIQANDRKGLLLVVGVNRDASGRALQLSIADCTHRQWPEIISVEDASLKIGCGDWVVLGEDKKDEYFRELGHMRSCDELSDEKCKRFRKIMKRNRAFIRPVLRLGWNAFDPVERNIAISDVVDNLPKRKRVSPRWIRALMLRYWQSGCNQLALGPQNFRAGATARRTKLAIVEKTAEANPDPRISKLKTAERLANEYIEHPLNQAVISVSRRRYAGMPWKEITQHVNKELKKLPAFSDVRLTRRQVAYLMQPVVDLTKVIRRTKGHRHANTNLRTSNGDYRDVATYSGARYEFDGVNADLFVTDEFTGAVIARLQLYLVVDVFSGMITGIYGSLGALKKADAPRALHVAFAPKAALFKMLDLDISPAEWPCEGVPEMIGADNAELRTAAAECLPELCDIGLARPYRGDDKGSVEKNADLIQVGHLIKYGPGYTEGPKKRAADNPADKAYVNVKIVLRELVRYIVKTHNHRPLPVTREIPDEFLKTRKTVTPFNLWTWSIRRAGGALAQYNQNTMMPRLLPSEEATITDKGIHVKSLGLYYDLPAELNNLRIIAACGGPAKEVRIFYDPLFLNMVYLADKDRSKPLIRCPLAHISRDHADRTKEEMEKRLDYVKILHQLATDEFEKLDNATNEAQREAALESVKTLKKHFRNLHLRNAVAKQLDGATVEEVQNTLLALQAANFFKTTETVPVENKTPPPPGATPPPTSDVPANSATAPGAAPTSDDTNPSSID